MNKIDFPIFQNQESLIYLDNSATTQKPKQVIKAITNFYENYNSNVHRGIHTLSQQATMAYEDARETIANFINATSKETIFTSGTTESLNFLAKSLTKSLNEGDEILLTDMEHHSNIVPWQQAAKDKNLTIKFIPITKDYKLDLDKAKDLITEKTKIISITHMSNVLGTINPIKKIIDLAHQHDILTIIDAAQSVPHMKVDVKDLDCDFLVFSGHKMCGPTGIGVLYGKESLLNNIEPVEFGGGMIKEVHFNNSTWADLPEKFEAGTPPISQAIALAEAVKYLEKIGMGNIEKYNNELTIYVLEKFKQIPHIKLFGPSNQRGPVFSFSLENIHPHDLSEHLNEANIAVRAGNHCAMPLMNKLNLSSTTRASFYLYNTKEDVDKLFTILNELSNPINKNEITSENLTEEQEIYKENIIDHYRNPHNKGELEDPTFQHQEFNPICGDKITLQLNIYDNTIQEIKWHGDGCAISQASISLLSDELINLPLENAKEINEDKILELLGIPISHTRIKCALLSLKTLQGVLK